MKISKEILEEAEQERLEYAEKEAKFGVYYE